MYTDCDAANLLQTSLPNQPHDWGKKKVFINLFRIQVEM